MGHSTIQMTMRYAHLSARVGEDAVELLGSKVDTIWSPGGRVVGEDDSIT